MGCWPLVAERTCIKGGFHVVHALFHIIVHSVHARCMIKCILDIFSLIWTSMSTKPCFLIRNMFGSLVMFLAHLAPHVYFSCIGYALHIATSCTHLCYPCHALVYTLFLHPNMSCLPVALCFVLALSFIFLFILLPSCIIIIVRSFISCPHFSLALCLFLTKRGRVL